MSATPPVAWTSLRDPDTFARFHQAYARSCTQVVHRRYRRLAFQCRVSRDTYQELVDMAVSDAFTAIHAMYDDPRTDRRYPLGLLVSMARRRFLRLLDEARGHLEACHPLDDAILTPRTLSDTRLDAAVHATLEVLPPRQAQALAAHYLENQPIQDVAAAMETTEAGVKCLLQRGRQDFRRHWPPEASRPTVKGAPGPAPHATDSSPPERGPSGEAVGFFPGGTTP